MVEFRPRNEITTLTVGKLRTALAELPDDAPVELCLNTEYDGEPTQRSGPATDCGTFNGRLCIDGTSLVCD